MSPAFIFWSSSLVHLFLNWPDGTYIVMWLLRQSAYPALSCYILPKFEEFAATLRQKSISLSPKNIIARASLYNQIVMVG